MYKIVHIYKSNIESVGLYVQGWLLFDTIEDKDTPIKEEFLTNVGTSYKDFVGVEVLTFDKILELMLGGKHFKMSSGCAEEIKKYASDKGILSKFLLDRILVL